MVACINAQSMPGAITVRMQPTQGRVVRQRKAIVLAPSWPHGRRAMAAAAVAEEIIPPVSYRPLATRSAPHNSPGR